MIFNLGNDWFLPCYSRYQNFFHKEVKGRQFLTKICCSIFLNVYFYVLFCFLSLYAPETYLLKSLVLQDKYNYIGLSQTNLRVHYKGHGKTHKVRRFYTLSYFHHIFLLRRKLYISTYVCHFDFKISIPLLKYNLFYLHPILFCFCVYH